MKDIIRAYSRKFGRDKFKPLADWTLSQAVNIQQIPAPTFEEAARAQYVATLFEQLQLEEVRTDALYNVVGVLRGTDPTRQGIMLMAHTDTVFNAQTDLSNRRERDLLYAPGLGDNSIGVAGMCAVVEFLRRQRFQPPCDIWLVASSREEGLGDLDGARLAFETLKARVGLVINVEGLAYGYVYHAGIAVRRLHVSAHTQGGHSWLHFGRDSATHRIMQLGAAITQINPPEQPRTTYNIGMIEGGHSINSIATDAALWLDMRSESTEALEALEQQVRAQIQAHTTSETRFEVKIVGDRPSGAMEIHHPLIQGALAALEETGVRGALQIGSTDGNIPLSQGCPTVTVGITRGGNAHRLDEFIEISPIAQGLRHLLILTLAAADYHVQEQG